jgi:hypothetical protein
MGSRAGSDWRTARDGAGDGTPLDSGWRPLSGGALLERLRVTGRPRPPVTPSLVAELRSLLGSGIGDLPTEVEGGRLVITKDRLTRALSCPVHRTADRFGERNFSVPLACGALVDVLFRQVVTTGAVGDPMAEALDGLALDGHQASLVTWISEMAPADLAELRSEVDRQTFGLVERWPALEASWLPRTQESIRVALAGSPVEFSARVDLAIGQPAEDDASVAFVEVKSGARRPEHRDDLRFYALVEALRSQAPPFAVASYYTRTGELDVEPVTHDLLVEAAHRCLAGIRVLAGVADGSVTDGTWCAACAALPRAATVARPPAVVDTTVVAFPHGQAA